jgi:hypothetical protein
LASSTFSAKEMRLRRWTSCPSKAPDKWEVPEA